MSETRGGAIRSATLGLAIVLVALALGRQTMDLDRPLRGHLHRTTETEQYLAAATDRVEHPEAAGLLPAVWWIPGLLDTRVLYPNHPALGFRLLGLPALPGRDPLDNLSRMKAFVILLEALGALGLFLLASRSGGHLAGGLAAAVWLCLPGVQEWGDMVEVASLGLHFTPLLLWAALGARESRGWLRYGIYSVLALSAALTSWYAYLLTPALAVLAFDRKGSIRGGLLRLGLFAWPFIVGLATNLSLMLAGLPEDRALNTFEYLLGVLGGGDQYEVERQIDLGASFAAHMGTSLGPFALFLAGLSGLLLLGRRELRAGVAFSASAALLSFGLLHWIAFPTRAATHVWFSNFSATGLALFIATAFAEAIRTGSEAPSRRARGRAFFCALLILGLSGLGLLQGARRSMADIVDPPWALIAAIEDLHGPEELLIFPLDPMPPGLRLKVSCGVMPQLAGHYLDSFRPVIEGPHEKLRGTFVWIRSTSLPYLGLVPTLPFDPATARKIAVGKDTWWRCQIRNDWFR